MTTLHDTLAPLVADRYLTRRKHPEFDLWIYNYTEKAQFEKHWTPETLMCRGLIVDADGTVVARPFPKFFNLSEHGPDWRPPAELTAIQDKVDGSLGILYWTPDGRPWIATRGSFVSPQAQHATRVFRERYADLPWDRSLTHLFEIVYPTNRIVVDYGAMDDLVLLAVRETATGAERKLLAWFPHRTHSWGGRIDMDHVRRRLDELGPNTEGLVLLFADGTRVKVKTDEYVRLHRLLTGVTPRRISDLLATGVGIDELLRHVPEEFADWVRQTADELGTEQSEIVTRAYQEAVWAQEAHGQDRGAIAWSIKDHPLRSLIFLAIDGKDVEGPAWKLVRPAHAAAYRADADEQQEAA